MQQLNCTALYLRRGLCCNSAPIDILHTFHHGTGRLMESAEALAVDSLAAGKNIV